MTICDGRGGTSGGHCCVIGGQVCRFLVQDEQRVRCGLLLELGTWEAVYKDRRWRPSKVGRWFAEHHPGFGCGDWPQNIPEAMASPSGKCCWQDD